MSEENYPPDNNAVVCNSGKPCAVTHTHKHTKTHVYETKLLFYMP